MPLLIRGPTSHAAPSQYTLSPREALIPESVTATFNGAAAAGAFLPTISVYAQSGELLARSPATQVAAGSSAEVTFAPLLRAAQGAASSSVIPWPAAVQASSVLDNTSWDNTPDGVGKYEALAIDGGATTVLGAWGYEGDAFPFMVCTGYANFATQLGFWFGDGTFDPYNGPGNAGLIVNKDAATHHSHIKLVGDNQICLSTDAMVNHTSSMVKIDVLRMDATQGAGNPLQMSVGYGAPTIGGRVGDLFWRLNGAAGTYLYRCTVAGGDGASTWVGIL